MPPNNQEPGTVHSTTLEEAIVATLSFFAIFHHPLTLEELFSNFLRIHPATPSLRAESERSEGEARQSPSIADLEKICEESDSIVSRNGLYALPSDEGDFDLRTKMLPILEQRLARVRRYAPLLRHVPFVRGVFLCNNLSFGIATEKGDIDLLIVTTPGHIFIARFLCTVLFHFFGIRRHGRKTTDRFCLSFYVTEDNVDFSTFALQPQDVYLAYWTKNLLPCFRSQTSTRISEANREWLRGYFYEEEPPDTKPELSRKTESRFQNLFESLFLTSLGRWLEDKLTTYQKDKLERSSSALADRSGTVVSDTMLKFHDRDKRREYQESFTKSCARER